MKKSSIVILLIFVGLVVGLAFFQTPIMRSARSYVWEYAINSVSRVIGLGNSVDNQNIIEQNSSLRAENARLQAEVVDYRRLRQQLGSPSFGALRAIPAAVGARPIDTFRSQYILNKGIDDGVVLNSPVVINGSVLVGFISDIHNKTSVMTTLLNPTNQLTVEIGSADAEKLPARGLLESQHFTSLMVTTIPRDTTIASDQPVVTVAKDKSLPQGLVVGSIEAIINPEHDAYQSARIRLPYDPDLIDAVHVLVAP